MNALRRTFAACLALLLAACMGLQQKEQTAGQTPVQAPVEELPAQPVPQAQPAPAPRIAHEPTEVERALAFFDRLRRLPATELAREHETVRRDYAQSHSDFDRIRLAMMYALPNTPFTEDTRALELVEPLIRDASAELHRLAVLVGVFAKEQKRLGAREQSLHQQVQSLEQKLDALRSLERSMVERESGAGRRK